MCFRLREPWPDFLFFLGTPATGTGLIVPQKYLDQVGAEPTTRLVALKKGEVDIAYALHGEIGRAVQRDPQLTLRVVSIPTTY